MKKKVAVVTGASRGIGRAISETLASNGYHLILCCRKQMETLHDLAREWEEKYNISCYTQAIDVSRPEEVEAFIKNGTEAIGPADVLVNNAGISFVGLLTDMTPTQWRDTIETNLSSAFYLSRMVLPSMISRKEGRIINISSVWGNVGASCEVAYSASKGGLNSFTKALAKEMAPSHICVNAISCGIIDTSMNSCFSQEELNDICEEIPAGRMGTPAEVAEMVLQLTTSPDYLTGQILTIDGGWC